MAQPLIHTQEKLQTKEPPTFQVLLLNDDYTPMDFVVDLLKRFFAMSQEKAEMVMWQVHTQGKAVCGIYSRDIALTKKSQVIAYARDHGYPLQCSVEAV